eukprot:TRINITY_DN1439_c0_g2_i2.p1 TRINITY_DN1439_c0_g2~~TRINITY_DN1439_c0_g2_i2.p1  ORF type:complete len:265 (-),score=40.44 TRINITY_DN1439_c0_g2_i2:328-1122(-)
MQQKQWYQRRVRERNPVHMKKLIIDTDGGVDDAYAICYAVSHPGWEVIAITCTCGNVNLAQATRNVGTLLKVLGKTHIPIYKGAARSIISRWNATTWEGHGDDGMGNQSTKYTEYVEPQEEHAVDFLVRKCRLVETNLHILCLGPLTNIALAICMSNEFAEFLGKMEKGQFVVMGGCHLCQGNKGLASEFNIGSDPEAAQICFDTVSTITLVSFGLTRIFSLTWDWYDKIIKSHTSSPVIRYLENIANVMESFYWPSPCYNFFS